MSKPSWVDMLKQNNVKIVKKKIRDSQENIIENINTDKCIIENRFMNLYGWKTTELWCSIKEKYSKSLLSKCKSSTSLHEFILENIYISPKQLMISIEDSDDTDTDDYIE